jgi:hypothetical protein
VSLSEVLCPGRRGLDKLTLKMNGYAELAPGTPEGGTHTRVAFSEAMGATPTFTRSMLTTGSP